MVHADLRHQKARIVGCCQQCERHADVVVEALRARVGRARRRKDALEQPPRGGLARAARHADDAQLEQAAAPCVRNGTQRSACGADTQQTEPLGERSAVGHRRFAFHDRHRRARLRGLGDESVPVEPLPGQRDEARATQLVARVRGETRRLRRRTAQHVAPGCDHDRLKRWTVDAKRTRHRADSLHVILTGDLRTPCIPRAILHPSPGGRATRCTDRLAHARAAIASGLIATRAVAAPPPPRAGRRNCASRCR